MQTGQPMDPVVVNVTRGGRVESTHRGRVVVSDAGGAIHFRVGDIDSPIFPRSAIKPLQATLLVESGAASHFALGPDALALASASHGGEPRHIEALQHWLNGIEMSEADLQCGSHWPTYEPAACELVVQGRKPTQIHNNCSGKHVGFLAVARHLGMDTQDYIAYGHPLQARLRDVLGAFCDLDMERLDWGLDGCSIPTYDMPMRSLALGMARFADPKDLGDATGEAVRQVAEAMSAEPFMVAGTGRYCSRMMEAAGPRLLVKTGAEGVYCAALPEHGLGIALKCDDGATRAAEVMMTSVLRRLGVIDKTVAEAVSDLVHVELRNWAGRLVGEVHPCGPLVE